MCPRSSAWIEHLPSKQGVAGSNPVGGICGGGTVVTAVGCSPTFPGFESRPPLK